MFRLKLSTSYLKVKIRTFRYLIYFLFKKKKKWKYDTIQFEYNILFL